MSVTQPPSLTVTPRATVIEALARREAELLGHRCASAHLHLAIVWEGEGVAAHVLSRVDAPRGRFEQLREEVANMSDDERGFDARAAFGAAADEALAMGVEYIGTEHQLLAIVGDHSLVISGLPHELRAQVRKGVHEVLTGP